MRRPPQAATAPPPFQAAEFVARPKTRSLDVTLRRSRYTRGRLESESPQDLDSSDEQLCSELLRMLNGNWSLPTIVHYCWEPNCCCGGKVGAARSRIMALLSAALVDRLGENLPSAHRWHTISPALTTQAGTVSNIREQRGLTTNLQRVRPVGPRGRDRGLAFDDSWPACCGSVP